MRGFKLMFPVYRPFYHLFALLILSVDQKVYAQLSWKSGLF